MTLPQTTEYINQVVGNADGVKAYRKYCNELSQLPAEVKTKQLLKLTTLLTGKVVEWKS